MNDSSAAQAVAKDSTSAVDRVGTNRELEHEQEGENEVTEIESLCMACHNNGITKLKILHIPFFHEVLLESFNCENCGYENTTIKPAGKIQEKGCKFTFRLDSEADFQRQVIKNDSATFKIEDLDLEMPPGQGQLSNLEGLLTKILVGLEADQPQRKRDNLPLYEALDGVIEKLKSMMNGSSFPFYISLDDPSGNSSIEPSPADTGTKYTRVDYSRDHGQNVLLGLAPAKGDSEMETPDLTRKVESTDDEIYEIPSQCPGCSRACSINVKKVKIPHFKEVMIMSTVCDHCGYTTREVKTGGEVPEKGERIMLLVESITDLSRDVLKSETCALKSPELGLEVQAGTLGGRFTTVEGLLSQVREQLQGQIFDVQGPADSAGLTAGDSMPSETRKRWNDFFAKLDQAIQADIQFSIILEDPLANSYVQSLADEEPDDRQLRKEYYERTAEEIDHLGLAEMKTENYEFDEPSRWGG